MCSGIDFVIIYSDQVDPEKTLVDTIIESKHRFLTCKKIEADKKSISTTQQSRGTFTLDNVMMYLKELEEHFQTINKRLPPFGIDRIVRTWNEAMRCYLELKKEDRSKDYRVVLDVGKTILSSTDWHVRVSCSCKKVTLDSKKNMWLLLEEHKFYFE